MGAAQNIGDITERKTIQTQLEFLSLHDQLTGLYNRAYFDNELLKISASGTYPITLISSDIDGLKLINDSLGHQAGDDQLVACAEILKKSVRSSDIIARVGGDEFCIIMPNTDYETGESIARRIRNNISEHNEINLELPLGLSFGLVTSNSYEEMSKDELCRQADNLMYRDKLYRSANISNKIVKSLLAVLAERDNSTEGDLQRLEELCLALGEKVNLNARQLADLALLVKVHDLGKVGIPDQVRYKEGPLDQVEWEIMKQHPEKGFRIAMSSTDLVGVAHMILKHHEQWDGSGYPVGLTGEDIPIECRILAIAVAYDAMTNERPHMAAKSRQEALEEISRLAGSQYDPNLVKAFIAMLEDDTQN